jgi:hypothetical protein
MKEFDRHTKIAAIGLTEFQKSFAEHYVEHFNIAKAVREAGSQSKNPGQQIKEYLSIPKLQAYISILKEDVAGRVDLRRDYSPPEAFEASPRLWMSPKARSRLLRAARRVLMAGVGNGAKYQVRGAKLTGTATYINAMYIQGRRARSLRPTSITLWRPGVKPCA